jgi:hypothetical protein
MSVKTSCSLVSIAILGVLFAGIGYQQGWFDATKQPERVAKSGFATSDKDAPALEEMLRLDAGDLVEVGGVRRPKRDLEFDQARIQALSEQEAAVEMFPNPGRAIQLKGDENPQVRQVFEEAQSPDTPLPNRLTRFQPEPFDPEAYARDPQAYLSKVVPGRIFQTAQPGPDVTPIAAASRLYHRVIQGEAVTLEVHVDPLQPVSWYTQAAGEFDSRLTTYTTAADENGVARATYLATTGTMGLVHIIASSPVHSEQIEFVVNVNLPVNAGTP